MGTQDYSFHRLYRYDCFFFFRIWDFSLAIANFLDLFGRIVCKYSSSNNSIDCCLCADVICVCESVPFGIDMDTYRCMESLHFFLSQWLIAKSLFHVGRGIGKTMVIFSIYSHPTINPIFFSPRPSLPPSEWGFSQIYTGIVGILLQGSS